MNFISQLLETFFKMVYSSFKDNTKGADLADMQLASKYNKGIRFLLCAIDIFSKYVWIAPLKDKNGVIIVNAFQCILDSSTSYGLIRAVNFITALLKNGQEMMT